MSQKKKKQPAKKTGKTSRLPQRKERTPPKRVRYGEARPEDPKGDS